MTERAFTSPLADQFDRFLLFKRSAGCRYLDEERALRVLDRFLATRLPPGDPVVTLGIVREFVARKGDESETTRGHRLSLIRQVCRFLAIDEPRTAVPPPRYLGIKRRPFVARVLSRDEGRRLLVVCAALPPGRSSPLRGIVNGTVLTLLYLAGIRLGEALNLDVDDVNLAGEVICIRRGKFGKSRLVPIAPDLAERLSHCRQAIEKHFGSRLSTPAFFVGPKGERCTKSTLRASFRLALRNAGIPWLGRGRGPRVHDLRHSFSVHRLLLWYEQDADLDAKLPLLSTYLGHISLASSQCYLQLTEDLLGQVTQRFDTHFGHLIVERSAQ